MASRIGITGPRGVLAQAVLKTWGNAEFQLYSGDVTDFAALRSWLEECQPLDGLLHLAARVATQRVEADPWSAFQSNVGGTCNILEAARQVGPPGWIFVASTSHVYRSSPDPLPEDAPLEPISLYGQTKRQAEQWAEIYQDKYQMPLCVGRIFSYTSVHQPPAYLIPSLFRRFSQAEPDAVLEIPGLQGSRDFLTAEGVAALVEQLFEKKAAGIVNVASGERQSLQALAEEIRRLLGRTDVEIRSLGSDRQNLVADVTRLRQLGIAPSPALFPLLRQFLPQ